MKLKMILAASLLATTMSTGAALAEDHQVQMLSRGTDGEMMVFEPAYLEIAPGDTVTFVPTQPSHNAESILTMMPEGAEAFKGRINQEVTVSFDVEGVYGVKCLPHYGLGMVALIKVGEGEAPNLAEAAAVRHPGKANQRFHQLFDLIGAE